MTEQPMGMVERVARAICIGIGDDPDREGERLTAYDAAARAAIAAMPGWEPIETAPESEQEPILLSNGNHVVPGWRFEGGWIDCWYDWMNPQPTHWMPLPAPPTEPLTELQGLGQDFDAALGEEG